MIKFIIGDGEVVEVNDSSSVTSVSITYENFEEIEPMIQRFINGDFETITVMDETQTITYGVWHNLIYDHAFIGMSRDGKYEVKFIQRELTEADALRKRVAELESQVEASADYVTAAKVMLGEEE